jgi:hypothetical protein
MDFPFRRSMKVAWSSWGISITPGNYDKKNVERAEIARINCISS